MIMDATFHTGRIAAVVVIPTPVTHRAPYRRSKAPVLRGPTSRGGGASSTSSTLPARFELLSFDARPLESISRSVLPGCVVSCHFL